MQEYIKNFINEFCNKETHTEKDVKKLEQNIIKFGCEIFNIDESAFDDLPGIPDSNPSLYIPNYGRIVTMYECEDRTKVANYLAMCNLYMICINNGIYVPKK